MRHKLEAGELTLASVVGFVVGWTVAAVLIYALGFPVGCH